MLPLCASLPHSSQLYPHQVLRCDAQSAKQVYSMQALAKQYPQQMYFPFNLSRQHYGPEGQARADSLQPLLSSPLMEQWGAALNDTTYPAQRWEGWVGRLSGLVAAGDKVCSHFAMSQPYPTTYVPCTASAAIYSSGFAMACTSIMSSTSCDYVI